MIKTFDPKQVVLIYGGNPIEGYADGTFVEVAANAGDGFTKQVGADGEVARAKSTDNTHEVTITLMQSSASNAYLSTIRNKDKMGSRAVYPLEITDLNGETKFSWEEAWVHGDPSYGFGKDLTERQWVLSTGQAKETNFDGLPATEPDYSDSESAE